MTNTYSTNRAAVTINNFYAYAANLKDRRVLVLGGGARAYREILRLVDAGCILTIVASEACAEIDRLAVTHASRAVIVPLSAQAYLEQAYSGQGDSAPRFDMAFLLCDCRQENQIIATRMQQDGVPTYFLHQPELSDFVPASQLKRGHLKIAVSTDGICQPMEQAIARRIEELFVHDFDHYSLFLSAVEERLEAFKQSDGENWNELNRRLEREDFYLAISRKNFEEALRIVDNHIEGLRSGRPDDNYETGLVEEIEEDIMRPRNPSKGATK